MLLRKLLLYYYNYHYYYYYSHEGMRCFALRKVSLIISTFVIALGVVFC